MIVVGEYYLRTQRYGEAYALFEKASARGHPLALYGLAWMHEDDKGLDKLS